MQGQIEVDRETYRHYEPVHRVGHHSITGRAACWLARLADEKEAERRRRQAVCRDFINTIRKKFDILFPTSKGKNS